MNHACCLAASLAVTFGMIGAIGTVEAQPARAERKLAVAAGAGLSSSALAGGDLDEDYTFGVALQLDVGYRVLPRLALGAHAGLATGSSYEYIADAAEDPFRYTPLELGVSAQLALPSRLWAAPWLGKSWITRQGAEYGRDESDLAYGLALGSDLFVRRDGHRLGAYARVMQTSSYDDEGVRGYAFGVSYRRW
jgi:hypothetical protein